LSLPALRKTLIQLEVASMEVIIRVKSFQALRDRLFVSKKPFFSNSKGETSEITKQKTLKNFSGSNCVVNLQI
jgi:hypothetical protein